LVSDFILSPNLIEESPKLAGKNKFLSVIDNSVITLFCNPTLTIHVLILIFQINLKINGFWRMPRACRQLGGSGLDFHLDITNKLEFFTKLKTK